MTTGPAPRRIGVLLINIGSPAAPVTGAVRSYLRQFLGDPRVMDLPPLSRFLLLHGVLLRFRPRRSAEAYRRIWTEEGSPLLASSRAFLLALRRELPDHFRIELGMCYGRPSLEEGLSRLRAEGVQEIRLCPLFPQYASATTGSALEAAFRLLGGSWNVPSVTTLPPFGGHPLFLEALADGAAPILAHFAPDRILLTFHGLPERHIRKSEERPGHCLAPGFSCCESEVPAANGFCYRRQCVQSARLLETRLREKGVEAPIELSFQSRLGRETWLGPYTHETLQALPRKGVKRLAVLCPSFVADCLETLEEIGMEGRKTFLEAGGEEFRLLPCLNADPAWVRAFARMVQEAWSGS